MPVQIAAVKSASGGVEIMSQFRFRRWATIIAITCSVALRRLLHRVAPDHGGRGDDWR
jgi:hypothetical protein